MFQHLREEDRSEALEGFQELLIKQSRGNLAKDISNRDTSSCGDQTKEFFLLFKPIVLVLTLFEVY